MPNTVSIQSDDSIMAWLRDGKDDKPIPARVPPTAHKRGEMTTQLGSLREKILLRRIMREGLSQ